MIELLFIKDTITGKTLQVIGQPSVNFIEQYLVIKDSLESVVVKKASIRKVIRTWMKGVQL